MRKHEVPLPHKNVPSAFGANSDTPKEATRVVNPVVPVPSLHFFPMYMRRTLVFPSTNTYTPRIYTVKNKIFLSLKLHQVRPARTHTFPRGHTCGPPPPPPSLYPSLFLIHYFLALPSFSRSSQFVGEITSLS